MKQGKVHLYHKTFRVKKAHHQAPKTYPKIFQVQILDLKSGSAIVKGKIFAKRYGASERFFGPFHLLVKVDGDR